VTAPDNTQTTMAYDASGNVLTVTDADNHTVTNVYDADNRLIQTTNGRGDVVKYVYDGTDPVTGAPQKGLLSSKTDGNGHMTFYNYTARNEPAATYYADGISESVTYDAGGNTLTRTKADGKVIHYAYDKDNRLTDITYPALHATHFDYDAGGRKTHMSDATGDTTWTYGDGVHLTTQQTPQGTVGYAYDSDGRRTIMSLAGTTGDWYYGYDSIGSLLSLQSPADGVTHFAYDAANRLTQKTLGSSNYETYAYDAADQMTGIGYWWADGNLQNSLTYSYTPGGNVSVCNQGWYNTTYAYDGANQLVSETGGGTYAPPTYAYTYDHNGNRLTQSSNGTQVQSFTYDAHDKLSTGTFGNEREGYDKNGSETNNTLTGAVFTYDDEDRLVQAAYPGPGITDSFTYNGLGLRVGKTDSTGSYSYVCDGASPGSPVLSDGHAVYTPGLSERRDGVTTFDSFDRLGNLWTVDGTASQYNQTYYQDTTAFGSGQGMGIGGTDASPFKFGGANGCQSDGDTGLVLMGHRYYDTRIGRFISQDPAGDGDNWYAYAGNSPTNNVDPTGLVCAPFNSGGMSFDNIQDHVAQNGGIDGEQYTTSNGKGGSFNWTFTGASFGNSFMQGGMGLNMGSPGQGGGRRIAQSTLETPAGAAEVGQAAPEELGTLSKPVNPLSKAVESAKKWLGDLGKHFENDAGNHGFMNKAGTKKIRFDIKNPSPHENPHAHLEELINGKWRGVGQIYPKDVPPR